MANESTTEAVLTHSGKVLIKQADGSYREPESQTDWKRVEALTDHEIEEAARGDPDAPLVDDSFWATARVVLPRRIPKRHQGLRLDADVLDWFKAQGVGWQTRMNAVLRSYMEAQKTREPHG